MCIEEFSLFRTLQALTHHLLCLLKEIYWPASHVQYLLRKLNSALAEEGVFVNSRYASHKLNFKQSWIVRPIFQAGHSHVEIRKVLVAGVETKVVDKVV